jgi:tRNA A37 threonylcarbamoyladenosine biosynthesis protein TsaE
MTDPASAVPAPGQAGLEGVLFRFQQAQNLDEQQGIVFANELARALSPGDWLFLEGDLGAGKTTFVSWMLRPPASDPDGLTASFGSVDAALSQQTKGFVNSPTFALCANYPCLPPLSRQFSDAIHMDLYRIKSDDELLYVGLDQMVTESSLVIVEWPSQVSGAGWQTLWQTLPSGNPCRAVTLSIGHLQDNGKERSYRVSLESVQRG